MPKYCILDETKLCDDCGECSVCDLDPNKICDNCMKCLQSGADYRAIEIDDILDDDAGVAAFAQLRSDLEELSDEEEPCDCFKARADKPS